MDARAVPPALSPYHRFTRSEWAALRADTPLTLSMEDLTRLRSLNDPISLGRSRRDLSAAVAPARALCRGDPRPLQGNPALPRRRGRQSALYHRRRRLGRGRKIDPVARHASASVALAEHAEGRTRHHGRISCIRTRFSKARACWRKRAFRKATTAPSSCPSSPM